jgi:DNA polymerase II small subunit/DNA polymerase delta subunit B
MLLRQDILPFLQNKSEEELALLYAELQEKSAEQIEVLLQQKENNCNKTTGTISIVYNHTSKNVNKSMMDFVSYFTTRYKVIERMLQNRQGLQGLTSIKRITQKQEKETVSLIGLVKDIQETKKRNLIITLEDQTGEIPVIVNTTKKELFKEAKTLVADEVIGIVGVAAKNVIFADKIFWPEPTHYKDSSS